MDSLLRIEDANHLPIKMQQEQNIILMPDQAPKLASVTANYNVNYEIIKLLVYEGLILEVTKWAFYE